MTVERRPFRNGPTIRVKALTLVVWISAFHSLLLVAARADFKIVKHTDTELTLLISGTITQTDAKALQELSADMEHDYLTVYLDSKGGDVIAAMQIGRLIRKYEATTLIGLDDEDALRDPLRDANCYSSCALIFIAGVLRLSLGQLGLHRPYLASVPQSRQAVEKQVPLMLSGIKQYITEMGITDNFYEQMVNTEPSQMVIYNSDNYVKLVPENDPVHQEIEIAYEARHYGASTSEMREREIDSEKCRENFDCQLASLWGLSERAYRERYQNAKACRRADDFKLLLAMPKTKRRDNPLWIQWETCERNIMLRP
jgi:hypothetical protein